MVDIGISKMKNYLADAIECEKNVYIWSGAMKRVNDEMEQLYRDQNNANDELQTVRSRIEKNSLINKEDEEKKVSDSKKFFEKSERHKRRCIFMILVMPAICFIWGLISIPIIEHSGSIGLAILACFGIWVFLEAFPIIIFAVSIVLYLINRKHIDKSIIYDRSGLPVSCYDDEEQLKQQENELVERCAWLYVAEQCVTDWQDEIHKSYKQALSTRQKLYSLNILDTRFQNFFCVTAFYDYIQTGRVVAVNGYGGLAATLDRDQKHEEYMARFDDLCAIAEDTNMQQRYLVEQAREANEIQRQISNQISDLNRNAEYIAIQQTRTADAANRIYSQIRYGY